MRDNVRDFLNNFVSNMPESNSNEHRDRDELLEAGRLSPEPDVEHINSSDEEEKKEDFYAAAFRNAALRAISGA